MNCVIRPVEARDNEQLEKLVVATLTEFGCVGPGFASADPELKMMYETYQEPGSTYWVIEDSDTHRILGGGGFSRLKGTSEKEAVCELQKLYFYPEVRGMGFGRQLVEMSIAKATEMGYQEMYLETVHQMESAQGLYAKFGFKNLPCHKGATGHNKCTVFMSRHLVATESPLTAC